MTCTDEDARDDWASEEAVVDEVTTMRTCQWMS